MPIDPQRFPASNRPKVEIRRRMARPAATVAAVERHASVAVAAPPAPHVEEPDEPPTILRLVFPDADEVSLSSEAASNAEASRAFEEALSFVELDAVETTPALNEPVANSPPVDSRQTLLGPSEMAAPEVPTVRYDATELAPMLEEMAVRKVLLEQTLVRMRQSLDEENAEIEREAAEIVAEGEASKSASSPAVRSSAGRTELGAFFWLGSMVGTAILGWGLLWLLRGFLFDPALLRTGGVLALFGVIALGSNMALHLDALLPRSAARAEV